MSSVQQARNLNWRIVNWRIVSPSRNYPTKIDGTQLLLRPRRLILRTIFRNTDTKYAAANEGDDHHTPLLSVLLQRPGYRLSTSPSTRVRRSMEGLQEPSIERLTLVLGEVESR
jgi:hypothetical protein